MYFNNMINYEMLWIFKLRIARFIKISCKICRCKISNICEISNLYQLSYLHEFSIVIYKFLSNSK